MNSSLLFPTTGLVVYPLSSDAELLLSNLLVIWHNIPGHVWTIDSF